MYSTPGFTKKVFFLHKREQIIIQHQLFSDLDMITIDFRLSKIHIEKNFIQQS